MTVQFGRRCSLVIGSSGVGALDLSALHITFTVTQAAVQTPKSADIRIYNAAPSTIKRIRDEFTRVELTAGYEGGEGMIFAGQIKQIRVGRESGTDTYLDILATDSDPAYNYAFLSESIAAGATQDDVRHQIVSSFAKFGVQGGEMPELSSYELPRGKVLYGSAKDHMRSLAKTNGVDWSIADGRVDLIRQDRTLPGAAILLNSGTGLIGMPQQTIDGVTVKCLLNPRIKRGVQIKLDASSVQAYKMSADWVSAQNFKVPSGDADGYYKAYHVQHTGDTRGQAWYTEMICEAVDPTGIGVISQTYVSMVASNGD